MTQIEQRATIERYFAAMRRGSDAEDEMMSLFASDAEYTEPFTDPGLPAVGAHAIRSRLRAGWAQPLPDFELDVLSVEIADGAAISRWECRSPALPQPVRGTDRVIFDGEGLIARLDVTIDGAET